jgi:hypothetical protein
MQVTRPNLRPSPEVPRLPEPGGLTVEETGLVANQLAGHRGDRDLSPPLEGQPDRRAGTVLKTDWGPQPWGSSPRPSAHLSFRLMAKRPARPTANVKSAPGHKTARKGSSSRAKGVKKLKIMTR